MANRNNTGQFLPGHPGAKPKGSINEITLEIRGKLVDFLSTKVIDLDSLYNKLKPADKLKMLIYLSTLTLPKPIPQPEAKPEQKVIIEIVDSNENVRTLPIDPS